MGRRIRRSRALYREGQERVRAQERGEALRLFRASLALAEREKIPAGRAASLHAIAMIHVQEKRWREALSALERALEMDREMLEEARRKDEKAAVRALEGKAASDLNDLARLHRRPGEPARALRGAAPPGRPARERGGGRHHPQQHRAHPARPGQVRRGEAPLRNRPRPILRSAGTARGRAPCGGASPSWRRCGGGEGAPEAGSPTLLRNSRSRPI